MKNKGHPSSVLFIVLISLILSVSALIRNYRLFKAERSKLIEVYVNQPATADDESIDDAISHAHNQSNTIYVPVVYDLSNRTYEQICIKVKRITAYNARANQTDAHPFTMASNRPVYEGAVAISQDIIDKYKLQYGDLVYIESLDNYYIFEDKMAYGRKENEKVITDTIDVFMYSFDEAKKFHLKDQEVILFKINRNH